MKIHALFITPQRLSLRLLKITVPTLLIFGLATYSHSKFSQPETFVFFATMSAVIPTMGGILAMLIKFKSWLLSKLMRILAVFFVWFQLIQIGGYMAYIHLLQTYWNVWCHTSHDTRHRSQ